MESVEDASSTAHANVSVRGFDHDGLERLCRYLARPPVSHERLERLDNDYIGLELKTPYSDGTTHIAASLRSASASLRVPHFELIERLCALVPRLGTHGVGYHGVFASASPHRRLVVPTSAPSTTVPAAIANPEAETDAGKEPDPNSVVGKRRRIRRLLWAELLKRTFGVEPKECPHCGRQMKMIATIMRADVVKAILDAQGLPTDAPFIRPCRGPPSGELFEVWWR